MADKSKIEWTDASWNPIVGCSLVSPGCTNCYAMRAAWRFGRNPNTPQYHGLTDKIKSNPVWNGNVKRAPDVVLHKPLTWKQPRRIFVNSMGDLFHETIPEEWIDEVFAVMAMCPQHKFQVLTKRPERMLEYFSSVKDGYGRLRGDEWRGIMVEGMAQKIYHGRTGEDPSEWLAVHLPLPNVWLGVSAEDQNRADERIPLLLKAPAALRFISFEPLLESISADLSGIDWAIVGGESGPDARAIDVKWVRAIRDQCVNQGVRFFFKQWSEWLREETDPGSVLFRHIGKKKIAGRLLDGREWNEYPD